MSTFTTPAGCGIPRVNGSTRNALDLLPERVVDEVRSWSRVTARLGDAPLANGLRESRT